MHNPCFIQKKVATHIFHWYIIAVTISLFKKKRRKKKYVFSKRFSFISHSWSDLLYIFNIFTFFFLVLPCHAICAYSKSMHKYSVCACMCAREILEYINRYTVIPQETAQASSSWIDSVWRTRDFDRNEGRKFERCCILLSDVTTATHRTNNGTRNTYSRGYDIYKQANAQPSSSHTAYSFGGINHQTWQFKTDLKMTLTPA